MHHQRELNTEDDATKFFIIRAHHDFAHLRCNTQSIMIKVLSFHLVHKLHLDPYRVGRAPILKTKKVDLYKSHDLRWCAFRLRKMDERFHHPFTITCVVAVQPVAEKTNLWQNLFSMWNKWWHLRCKDWSGVTVWGAVCKNIISGRFSTKTATSACRDVISARDSYLCMQRCYLCQR